MRMGGAGEQRPGALTRAAESLQAGAAAGMIGGLAMVTFLIVHALAMGQGALAPLQWFGGLFYGSRTMEAGFSSAAWGLAVHLAVSSALGVPFALVIGGRTDPMAATAGGIVYGLVAWLVLTFLVLPVVDPAMARAVAEAPIGWFAAHVPYGASLALSDQFHSLLVDRERQLVHA